MRVAVVFDTPYSGWDHSDHERQMEREVAAWKVDEPEMEYQIAHALQECGHEIRLLGVRDDLEYLVRHLDQWRPDLVFNGAEAFRGDESLEYLLPGMLEAEGYRYTGAPPLALQMTRNKAISKKVLTYFGIQVPGFV
jgi:D-alanine-D-alanine ligase